MKSIDTLVSDIQELFDKGAVLTEEALNTFTTGVGGNLRERFEEYSKERKRTLRLSNVGQPLRKLWFEISSGLEPEPLPPEAKLKFLYGDLLEDTLILLAIEAGHTVTDLQKEVEVDGVRGHIDCCIDGVLVDVKSASTYSFRKFAEGTLQDDDPFGYIAQLAGYSCALGNLDGAFLAIDKTLGKLALLRISKEELQEYNVRERITKARYTLAQPEPPGEYCYDPIPEGKSGNLKLPVGCSYCAYKFHCYPNLRGFAYSTGPVYLVNVAQEPRVKEIKSNGGCN